MDLEERAAKIVLLVHQSMDWNVWGPKRLKYWQILTNAVRAAAYTNSLSRFVNSLCSRMQIRALGPNKAARAEADSLINGLDRAQERALLRLMREEATTVVLQVRVWLEAKRAAATEKGESEVRRTAEALEADGLMDTDMALWGEGDNNGLSV